MDDIEANYQKALDYLYGFVDYSLTRNLRYTEGKFDLTRMVALMQRLGNPQDQYPIIHVAGTKGKGSTAALCAWGLQAGGYKVGFYTSPHLSDLAERMQINGVPISHAQLVELVEELKPHVAEIQRLTTFELMTALAFLYFAREKVDFAVIEVGLGGRLDATNIVSPLVSVITSISYDHMAVLGNTLTAIAGEKAGIIKPGKPVVLAPQKDEARLVVERIAGERKSPLVEVEKEYRWQPLSHTLRRQTFLVWRIEDQARTEKYIKKQVRKSVRLMRFTIPLLGQHQVENAATAFATLEVVRSTGVELPMSDITSGFKQVNWPGRFEFLRYKPAVVIDSAHNRDSARRLRETMQTYLPGKPVVLLFGASEDKDIAGMFAELLPICGQVVTTQTEHPRAMEPQALAELARRAGALSVEGLQLQAAIQHALALAGNDKVVLATGSIFLAAAVRDEWMRRKWNEK